MKMIQCSQIVQLMAGSEHVDQSPDEIGGLKHDTKIRLVCLKVFAFPPKLLLICLQVFASSQGVIDSPVGSLFASS